MPEQYKVGKPTKAAIYFVGIGTVLLSLWQVVSFLFVKYAQSFFYFVFGVSPDFRCCTFSVVFFISAVATLVGINMLIPTKSARRTALNLLAAFWLFIAFNALIAFRQWFALRITEPDFAMIGFTFLIPILKIASISLIHIVMLFIPRVKAFYNA